MKVKKRKIVIVKTEVFEEVEMSFDEFIGYTISELRKQKNIKQSELAEKLDLSRMSIANIESGRQKVSLKHLKILCEIFECSAKDIIQF